MIMQDKGTHMSWPPRSAALLIGVAALLTSCDSELRRANREVERHANYTVVYFCEAHANLKDGSNISVWRMLSAAGEAEVVSASWQAYTFDADWRVTGQTNVNLATGTLHVTMDLYPALGGAKGKPDVYFADAAGHRLPLSIGWANKLNSATQVHAYANWGDMRATVQRFGKIVLIAADPASQERRAGIFLTPETVETVDNTLERLLSETRHDAWNYRGWCKAQENVPIVD